MRARRRGKVRSERRGAKVMRARRRGKVRSERRGRR